MKVWGYTLDEDDVALIEVARAACLKAGKMLRSDQITGNKDQQRKLNRFAVTGVLFHAGLEVEIPIGGWPGISIPEEEDEAPVKKPKAAARRTRKR